MCWTKVDLSFLLLHLHGIDGIFKADKVSTQLELDIFKAVKIIWLRTIFYSVISPDFYFSLQKQVFIKPGSLCFCKGAIVLDPIAVTKLQTLVHRICQNEKALFSWVGFSNFLRGRSSFFSPFFYILAACLAMSSSISHECREKAIAS